ncbi:hypothetical protein DFH06DRAFT_1321608 [Mycena polygramma]|nr:hypothetical protein DFH06DRAFT_1321608 [Mycena polygramma]
MSIFWPSTPFDSGTAASTLALLPSGLGPNSALSGPRDGGKQHTAFTHFQRFWNGSANIIDIDSRLTRSWDKLVQSRHDFPAPSPKFTTDLPLSHPAPPRPNFHLNRELAYLGRTPLFVEIFEFEPADIVYCLDEMLARTPSLRLRLNFVHGNQLKKDLVFPGFELAKGFEIGIFMPWSDRLRRMARPERSEEGECTACRRNTERRAHAHRSHHDLAGSAADTGRVRARKELRAQLALGDDRGMHGDLHDAGALGSRAAGVRDMHGVCAVSSQRRSMCRGRNGRDLPVRGGGAHST